jgi:hypothetical protein
MQYYNKMAKTKERKEKECYKCGELVKDHNVLRIGDSKLFTCKDGKYNWREKIIKEQQNG